MALVEKKYLIIDPGHSTGYCLVTINNTNKIGRITEYGYYEVNKDSEYIGDWCNDLKKWIKEKIKQETIEEIVHEDYFFSGRFKTGSSVNVSYRTAIDMTARKYNLPYHVVSPSIWKKFICGRSTPTKEQKKKYGTQDAKKYMIQEALWSRYQIRFPNYLISHKNGRNIKFRHDIVDAVAMGIYFMRILKGVNEVECDVECPDDIVWKGKVKTFSYETDEVPGDTKIKKIKPKETTKINNKRKCKYKFVSGKREGETCDSGIRGNYDLCSRHRTSKTVNVNKKTTPEKENETKEVDMGNITEFVERY